MGLATLMTLVRPPACSQLRGPVCSRVSGARTAQKLVPSHRAARTGWNRCSCNALPAPACKPLAEPQVMRKRRATDRDRCVCCTTGAPVGPNTSVEGCGSAPVACSAFGAGRLPWPCVCAPAVYVRLRSFPRSVSRRLASVPCSKSLAKQTYTTHQYCELLSTCCCVICEAAIFLLCVFSSLLSAPPLTAEACSTEGRKEFPRTRRETFTRLRRTLLIPASLEFALRGRLRLSLRNKEWIRSKRCCDF